MRLRGKYEPVPQNEEGGKASADVDMLCTTRYRRCGLAFALCLVVTMMMLFLLIFSRLSHESEPENELKQQSYDDGVNASLESRAPIYDDSPDDDENEGIEAKLDSDSSSTDDDDGGEVTPFLSESNLKKGFEMVNRCKLWTSEFREKYKQECSFWLQNFAAWQDKLSKESNFVAYVCEDPSRCRGWGDRLGGIQRAFFKALADDLIFRIGHPGLRNLFDTCLFETRPADWSYDKTKEFKPDSLSCVSTSSLQCYGWITQTCPKAVVTVNTDRVCVWKSVCRAMLQYNPKQLIQASNLLGCSLRALFEPSDEFRNSIKIPLRSNGMTERLTLNQIEAKFKDFYIISIHFRLGDHMAFYNKGFEADFLEEKFQRPFRCAQTLESYVRSHSGPHVFNETTNIEKTRKPVKWFVASDSYRLKKFISKQYSKQVIIIDEPPSHVALDSDALPHTLAEWYILGLGQQLIVNRMGTTPGQFFTGRVSAFAKTSWIYHLKHIAFDAGTCRRYSFPFEGIWSEIRYKACVKSSVFGQGASFLSQDHLKPLQDENLTFPFYYMDQGQIQRANLNSNAKQQSPTTSKGDKKKEPKEKAVRWHDS